MRTLAGGVVIVTTRVEDRPWRLDQLVHLPDPRPSADPDLAPRVGDEFARDRARGAFGVSILRPSSVSWPNGARRSAHVEVHGRRLR